MIFDALVTILAATRTTELAARVTGVRTFLPQLSAKRFSTVGGIYEAVFSRQMDACRSFQDAKWTTYWTALANDQLQRLDKELEKASLDYRWAIFGEKLPAPPSPAMLSFLSRGAAAMTRTPPGQPIEAVGLPHDISDEEKSSFVAVSALLKAVAYLFVAAWPGRTPARQRAYRDCERLFDILLDAVAPTLDLTVERHIVRTSGEEVKLVIATIMEHQTLHVPTPHGRLEAWIYMPPGHGVHPVIVMGCGVGAVKAAGLHPFAVEFCAAGYAAVAFDYMTFGGSDGQPRHLVDVSAEYRDFKNMIAWVKKQGKFDSSRIVAWGTSFGGMHVTRLLSEDHTVAADSVQLGFWGLCDWITSFVRQSPIYIQAAAVPGQTGLALMNAPDVAEGWQLLHRHLKGKEVDPHSNRIVARSVLWFPFHRPALKASSIIAPYLVVVPTFDSVAPKPAAEKMAETALNGELATVPGGHFDLYHGGVGYDSNLRAQLDFLKRHIPVHVAQKL
ncbi:alpha beta fold family hydrolase [Purpureocillium lavendulum]|uniref:Alpha beta fold family hydrolase n=1 Tax=Purpureocillium lavendulum TaxID=1247861 RepID=A0AB34FZ49_9HYPO|nr:alpha beta fold family hydrolase [Purpureocillium lavendulum]